MEIGRADTAWRDSIITLWWAAAALTLTAVGLKGKKRYLRYLALAVFGMTVVKVFLVDLAELSGLHRVAAFVGVGLLLLVLSFVYQRIAPMLTGAEQGEADETPKA
jgi:uncharacterized membrane protein